MSADPRWYESLFGEDWLRIAAGQDESALADVDVLVDLLGLEPGARILDCPCGTGRHSAELARRGFRVTGVDLNEQPLEVARGRGVDADFRQGDMRALPVDGPFDAVLNLWTSLGYFEDEADDARTLAEFARVLAPGGVLAVDTINVAAILASYSPRTWEELADGTVMLSENEYDHVTGRSRARWTLLHPDGSRGELVHSLRLYTAPELGALCRGAGLDVERVHPGIDPGEFTGESWRYLLLARKPG
ncbi:MAG TPA: methyltransferase domain-containing protein [Gaiellaceae bacterium]